jgi:putrescine aminotransferase
MEDRIYAALPQEEQNLMKNSQVVSRAEGSQIWMVDDDEPYLDFIMGYSSANFGHLNKYILSGLEGLKSDNVTFFTSNEREKLRAELGELLQLKGEWKFYFPVGGAMAVEAAARACLLAKPSGTLLRFKGAFHGYSGVRRALTDNSFLREDVFMKGSKTIKCLRPIDFGSNENSLSALDEHLCQGNIAGVFIEPVQGAAGFIDFGADFLRGVRSLCTQYDVPMVCDEIQSAFFRCGSLTVCLDRDVTPDILLLGKSFGSGIAPISAVVMCKDFVNKLPTDRAAFDSTFSGWTVGVSIARKVLELIRANDFKSMALDKGRLIDDIYERNLPSKFRHRIRRVGMAIAYDGPNADECERLRKELLNNHVIIQTAGVDGSKCKLSPSLTISDDMLTKGIIKMSSAIVQVAK